MVDIELLSDMLLPIADESLLIEASLPIDAFEPLVSAAPVSFIVPDAFMSVIDSFSVVFVVSLLPQAETANAAAATIATALVFFRMSRMSRTP